MPGYGNSRSRRGRSERRNSWKCAKDADSFTQCPHLTHGLNRTALDAIVTFPNSMRGDLRRRLVGLGEEGFFEVVAEIERNLRPVLKDIPGARPLFRSIQRHYKSQRSVPMVDALLEFDLRTAVGGRSAGGAAGVKPQSQWLSAAFDAFSSRRSNYQIQIGANFAFDHAGSMLARKDAWKLVANAWIAAKPMLDVALGSD